MFHTGPLKRITYSGFSVTSQCYGADECVSVCRWNQLDLVIVLLSIMGITLEKIEEASLPINPTIIRIMRVLRIARGTNTSEVPYSPAATLFVIRAWQASAGREATRWHRDAGTKDCGRERRLRVE